MPEDRTYYVYILGSISGTLYIGVTGNLRRRMWQHKNHVFSGFSADHNVDRLLYREKYGSVGHAIAREKQLKGWARKKKIALIEKENSKWRDLAGDWFEDTSRTLVIRDQSGRE
jgi:putative endonuclease